MQDKNELIKIDEIAQGIADITLELMRETTDWQLSEYEADGDDYNELRSYVMDKAIEKMAMELPEFRRLNICEISIKK